MPCSVLKACASGVAPVIAHLINASFQDGEFPQELKHARVIPVFKKGDRTDKNNYRPISILPLITKIFEKCFATRLLNFLKENDLLSCAQFGFLPGKSTTDAIFSFINDIMTDLDSGRKSVGIFFDFSKAFDTVDHRLLLSKLHSYGVRGKPKEWLTSYLTHRTQIVSLPSGIESLPSSLACGVPQGSIIGPLLFVIYVNDLANYMSGTTMCQYADDTSVSLSSDSISEVSVQSTAAVCAIEQWSCDNNLHLNIAKTNAIHFTLRPNLDYSVLIRSSTHTVSVVQSCKFLGIHLDSGLNWCVHIQSVLSALASYNFLILRLRSMISFGFLRAFYCANVEAKLRYGLIFWGQAPYVDRIFKLQKRILRSVFGAKTMDSCIPLFREAKLLTLPALYILECSMYVRAHPSQFARLGDVQGTYNTRNTDVLLYPRHCTASYERSAFYSCVKIYNNLPLHIRSLTSVKRFKVALREYLQERSYYSLNEYFEDRT